MKILCLSPIAHIENLYTKLCELGQVYYHPNAERKNVKELINCIFPEIIFINPNRLNYRLDASCLCESVKIIATASTGTNHIDLKYCDTKGVKVLSLTLESKIIESISSTAELAFGLTLSIIRHIPKAFESVKRKQWDYMPFIGRQLRGLNVGVVGYGRLGSMYASFCKAFGMNVYICDPYKKNTQYENLFLSELVAKMDIISLHVHLNEETNGMINSGLLSCINPNGMYIVNTSRGEVVNEMDIIDYLKHGKILGYATDVLSDELNDISKSMILKECDNLPIIVTPHIGGMTQEAQKIAYFGILEKLRENL